MKKSQQLIYSLKWTSLVLVAMVLHACSDEVIENTSPKQQRISVNKNASDLSKRVRIPQYEEMLSMYDAPKDASVNGRLQSSAATDTDYVLVMRAEVDAPVVENQSLRATHVFIEGDKAFVSYNTEGSVYRGGVDIFDISNIQSPTLIYQMIVEGTDYSSVFYADGKIYLAGATENTEDFDLSSNAILEIIEYPNNQDTSSVVDISSFTATDVKVKGDYIYVSSGSHGGLTILDKETLEEVSSIAMDDTRSIAFNSQYYAVMQGTPARIKIYNTTDNSYVNGFTVGGANIPESKSILNISEDKIFVPAGREGLKILDLNSGEILTTMPLPELEGIDQDLIVTNGVSVNAEKIFCANGAAGMYLSEQEEDVPSLIGSVGLNASANYVESKDKVMFVATGTGGLKIIEIVDYNPGNGDYIPGDDYDDDGAPKNLCEKATQVDQELENQMLENFIETVNLVDRKPSYFADGIVTDLFIEEDTDLKITFHSEATLYKNTLGYYIYDPANPPSTREDVENMTILYANASAVGSGGNLTKGDKVCLQNLKAGTAIGFFLVTKGWNGSEVTSGVYTHFTTKHLNNERAKEHQQASLLLSAEDHKIAILSFEDIRLPGGDKDYDDVIFLLEPTNENSVDFSALTPIR
ncbi:DUF4114 domain-containing protein [Porifericola rhodea]|uniref:DUF4114 domain-containing protein n=1 Tax=Porifericola rhodea TaxID=930972 RepID=UPI002665FEC6|nr:DUF4114 domain-containing protein [Porifericola rhodea]WKN32157.1 DUF4114 domain-containing protein [Porifericola rhodea]